jgi:HK97 gp10 family phage protein
MSSSIQITIDSDMEQRLRQMGPDLARRALREALEAGGEVLAQAIRERTPVETGLLRESVEMTVELNPSGNAGEATIGFGPDQDRIAAWVEFGHREVSKEQIEVGLVPAHPFVRPAFDEYSSQAADVATKVLSAALDHLRVRQE